MNNLRKFTTEAEYSAATLIYPSVAWITSTDTIHFDKTAPAPPTPAFSGLTVTYNITDISSPTTLFFTASGSGSGSGSGGVLPSSMIIDGTEVEVTGAYAFDTVGEHIVNYSFAENTIPNEFLNAENAQQLKETVRKVEIGDAITTIGYAAFQNCMSLTSVILGNGVTSIGDYAFNGCSSLTSITIPSGVTSIGGSAFSICTSLTSIVIPDSVTSIGNEVFKDCRGLTSIVIPDSVTSIGSYVFFQCISLTSCTIGSGVTTIGDGAFNSCSGLISIEIPSGVTSIGSQVFYNCVSLTSITSNAMTAPGIGSYTFQNIKTGGTLYVPSGSSGYDTWMQNANYYLGLYGWTKVEQ